MCPIVGLFHALELEGVCLRVLSVGVGYLDVECLPEAYSAIVDVFEPVEGYGSGAVIFVVELVFAVFPAGQTFTVALDDVEGAVGLAGVVLDAEPGAGASSYEAG
jgi:hypothetical protein